MSPEPRNIALAATLALCAVTSAQAAIVTLDFEGVGNLAPVGDFYNGGVGGGTNYGIHFSTATLGLIDSDAGGSGNFANEPSASTIMFFLDASNAVMDVAAGFTTGFSFFYSSNAFDGAVNVFDGLGATGNLLASLNLVRLGGGVGDPTGGDNGVWAAIGVLFNGTAKSVDFGGVANQIGFDNITFGTNKPTDGTVPVPAGMPLLLAGLGALGLLRRRKSL